MDLFTFDELGFPVEQHRDTGGLHNQRPQSPTTKSLGGNGDYVSAVLERLSEMSPAELAALHNRGTNEPPDAVTDELTDQPSWSDEPPRASRNAPRADRGALSAGTSRATTASQSRPAHGDSDASGTSRTGRTPYHFHDSVDYESLAREVAELQRTRNQRRQSRQQAPPSAREERSDNYRRTQSQNTRQRLQQEAFADMESKSQSQDVGSALAFPPLTNTHAGQGGVGFEDEEQPNHDNEYYYAHPEAADMALLNVMQQPNAGFASVERLQVDPLDESGDGRLTVGGPQNGAHQERHELATMIRRWKLYRGNPTAMFQGMDFQAPEGTEALRAQRQRDRDRQLSIDAAAQRRRASNAGHPLRPADNGADANARENEEEGGASNANGPPQLKPRSTGDWSYIFTRMRRQQQHDSDSDGDSDDDGDGDDNDSDLDADWSIADGGVAAARRKQQSAVEALRLLRLYAAFKHREEQQFEGVKRIQRRIHLGPFLQRWRVQTVAVHHHRLTVLRRFFERLRFYANQQLQRNSLLLVADEYRALRMASQGIVALQQNAGRRHVNRALTQLADAHRRRQRQRIGLRLLKQHVFINKKQRIQRRAAQAEGNTNLLRRCLRRWAQKVADAVEVRVKFHMLCLCAFVALFPPVSDANVRGVP